MSNQGIQIFIREKSGNSAPNQGIFGVRTPIFSKLHSQCTKLCFRTLIFPKLLAFGQRSLTMHEIMFSECQKIVFQKSGNFGLGSGKNKGKVRDFGFRFTHEVVIQPVRVLLAHYLLEVVVQPVRVLLAHYLLEVVIQPVRVLLAHYLLEVVIQPVRILLAHYKLEIDPFLGKVRKNRLLREPSLLMLMEFSIQSTKCLKKILAFAGFTRQHKVRKNLNFGQEKVRIFYYRKSL